MAGGEGSIGLRSTPIACELTHSAGESDADHAGGDDASADQALAQLTFLEQDAADQRGDHDGDLAPRHHVPCLGEAEGEEHEEVPARAEEAGEDDGGPVLPPLAHEGARAPEHGRQERHAGAQHHGPQIRQRIDVGDADLVHQGIRGDAEPGDDGPARAGPQQPALAPCAAPPVQREDSAPDEDNAENAEAREPLVEEVVRAHGHDGHTETARHRIHDREVPRLIRLAKREEVHAMQRHGGEHEGEGARRETVARVRRARAGRTRSTRALPPTTAWPWAPVLPWPWRSTSRGSPPRSTPRPGPRPSPRHPTGSLKELSTFV